jgi:hypothetical protein
MYVLCTAAVIIVVKSDIGIVAECCLKISYQTLRSLLTIFSSYKAMTVTAVNVSFIM